MSGYTDYTPKLDGPDFELAGRLAGDLPIPVIGEGRVHTPEEAVHMLDMGVWAVIAVSYTHRDVYKRQDCGGIDSGPGIKADQGLQRRL